MSKKQPGRGVSAMPKGTQSIPAERTKRTNIVLPTNLYVDMKDLRDARHEKECADVKLCRIFREATEQYVNAKPQQQLLREYRDGKSGKDRQSARVSS